MILHGTRFLHETLPTLQAGIKHPPFFMLLLVLLPAVSVIILGFLFCISLPTPRP